MNIPLDDVLEAVGRSGNDQASFEALRDIATKQMRRQWEKVRVPDIQSDILMATRWLDCSISEYQPTGVCFRLDSLHKRDGFDENVAICMTKLAEPEPLVTEWALHCERCGEKHLMWGLEKLRKSYLKLVHEYDAIVFANYIFFFGYSGIVLAAVLERLAPKWDCLFVWGFPDGDLCFLAKSSTEGVKRLTKPERDARTLRWGYTISD